MNKVIRPAKGIKGVLIKDVFGKCFIQGTDGNNYDIYHYDMDITIDDSDSYVYENLDGTKYIDYSPQTLGYLK